MSRKQDIKELIYFTVQKECYCKDVWTDVSSKLPSLEDAKNELDFLINRGVELTTKFRIVEKIEMPLPSTFVTVTPKEEE